MIEKTAEYECQLIGELIREFSSTDQDCSLMHKFSSKYFLVFLKEITSRIWLAHRLNGRFFNLKDETVNRAITKLQSKPFLRLSICGL